MQALRDAIAQQFGAAIDTLAAVIRACPEDSWTDGERWKQPWYLAFHTLFWLDLYLAESPVDYAPPAPFTRGELEPDVFPERAYSKAELLAWVPACREALAARLARLVTDQDAGRPTALPWGELAAGELLLYNLRHVQHHAAQLNARIRQAGGEPARWCVRADGPPAQDRHSGAT